MAFRNKESDMDDLHAFYAAQIIIDNLKPRTRREAILQEDKFYTDMAAASRLSRLFSAIAGMVRARRRTSVKKRDQGSQSTGCDCS